MHCVQGITNQRQTKSTENSATQKNNKAADAMREREREQKQEREREGESESEHSRTKIFGKYGREKRLLIKSLFGVR